MYHTPILKILHGNAMPPIDLTTPEPIEVPAQVLGEADHFEIMGFGYDAPYGGQPSLSVRWASGKRDPSDPSGQSIIWIQDGMQLFMGADLKALIAAPIVPGSSLYQQLKSTLYAALQARGIFPPGTVT